MYCSPSYSVPSLPFPLPVLGPNPAFATPGPRTETPTDLKHIGAFKLGSLRITNGPASPSPSPSRDGRANSLGAEEDHTIPGPVRKSIEKEQRHGLNQRSNTLSVPAEVRKAPWVTRPESPSRQAKDAAYKPLSINIPGSSFAPFDFRSTEGQSKGGHSRTKSQDLAHEYQREIASSPFSFDDTPLPSPRLEPTSKHTAFEDDLFGAEPITPCLDGGIRVPRSFDSAYEGGPVQKPKGRDEKPPRPLAKADSGYSSIVSLRSFKKKASATTVSPPAVPPKDSPSKPILEVFAGASSGSYSRNSSSGSETGIHSKRSLPALSVHSVADLPTEPTRVPPPVPPKALPVKSPGALEFLPVLKKSIEHISNVANVQPLLQIPKKTTRRKSLPAVRTASREMREESPAGSENSASSSSSLIWQRKKLNRRASRPSSFQPQSEAVSTFQGFRVSNKTHRMLEERGFTMQSFPNTISRNLRSRRTPSKETLGTIFSVGSAEIRDELSFARLQGALPAIPKEATIEEDPAAVSEWAPRPDFNKRHTFQPLTALSPPLEHQQSAESIQKSNQRGRSPTPSRKWAPRKLSQSSTSRGTSPVVSQELAQRRSFSLPGTREPSPAPSRRGFPSTDFETHITSVEAITSSLGRSSYELARDAIPKQAQPFANERARTMTAHYESDYSQYSAAFRNPNQGSQASTVRQRRSYESISKGSPFSNDNRSQTRLNMRGPPPQAHANGRRPYSFQHTLSREPLPSYRGQPSHSRERFAVHNDLQRRNSAIQGQKLRAAPPVSMTTQRRSLPNSNNSQFIDPPSQPQSTPSSLEDGWKKSAGAWAERRRSAGEALSARTSLETSRPTTKGSSFEATGARSQPQVLRGQKSMDANTYERSLKLREEHPEPQALRSGKSFDTSQQRSSSWNAGNGYDVPNLHTTQYYGNAEYSHTYGTAENSYHDKENFYQYVEQEYYEPEPEYDQRQVGQLPEDIHIHRTSTSDMLVLDRFSGGPDSGFELGFGLAGSAGRMGNAGRKSMRESVHFGVGMSEVPAIMHSVRMSN
jgi:hypothetical protein